LFGGLKLAGFWLGGMGAGFLADNVPSLAPDTHVPLGTAVGVGVACLGAAFWLSRQLTKLQDGQKSLKEGQARLEEGFSRLPCHQWPTSAPDCPLPPSIPPKKK
jgi:hypothetical protein